VWALLRQRKGAVVQKLLSATGTIAVSCVVSVASLGASYVLGILLSVRLAVELEFALHVLRQRIRGLSGRPSSGAPGVGGEWAVVGYESVEGGLGIKQREGSFREWRARSLPLPDGPWTASIAGRRAHIQPGFV